MARLLMSDDNQHVGLVMTTEEAARLVALINFSGGNKIAEESMGKENFKRSETFSNYLFSLLQSEESIKFLSQPMLYKNTEV